MYQMFKNYPIKRGSEIDVSNFDTVRKTINREADRIVDYYRKSSRVVDNKHLLNQILLNLNVSLKRDLESYVNACQYEAERLAKLFSLVHPVVAAPEIRYNTFYGSGVSEIIIVDERDFDFQLAYGRWKNLAPVKIHYHPFTDVNMGLLDGQYKNAKAESGYAVISINIALLALQYRAWLENTQTLDGSRPSIMSFILQYPVNNCIYRHTEIAVVNRTIALWYEKPVAGFERVHPLGTIDFTRSLDETLAKRVEILNKNSFRFDELFSVFEGLRKLNWFSIVEPPKVAPLMNVKWALELEVIHFIRFFVDYRTKRNERFNQSEINNLKRDIIIMQNTGGYYKGSSVSIDNILVELKQRLIH